MTLKKLTLKQLEQKFDDLEKENQKLKRRLKTLNKSEQKYRAMAKDAKDAIIDAHTEKKTAEKSHTNEAEAYRQYFENTAAGIVVSDPMDRIVAVNKAILKTGKYRRKDISKIKSVSEFYFNPKEWKKILTAAKKQGNLDKIETKFKRKDGTLFNALMSLRPVKLGGITCWQSTIQDITRQKQAEEAQKASEESYRLLVNNAFEGISVCQEMRFVFVNPRICEILGYSRKELISREIFDFVHSDDLKFVLERYRKRLKGNLEKPYTECRMVRKNGESWWVHISAVSTQWENRPAVMFFLTDIHELKLKEISLRGSEEKDRVLFENSYDAMFVTHPTSKEVPAKFIDVNKAACKRLGYTKEELLNLTALDIDAPELVDDIKDRIGKLFIHKKIVGEMIQLTKDNRRIPVENSTHQFVFKGQLTNLTVSRDISDRKRAENLMAVQRDLFQSLSTATSLAEGLSICLTAALNISNMDFGSIYLVDENTGNLDLVFYKGMSPEFRKSMSHYVTDPGNMESIVTGRPIYIEHGRLPELKGNTKQLENLRSIAVVPIQHEGIVIGCLNFASHTLDEILIYIRGTLEIIASRIGGAIVRIKMKEALQKAHDELEFRVKERTKDLETKSINLEEVNTALKVLLKKREDDKLELEGKVLINIKESVMPYLEKLNDSKIDERQKVILEILKSNLKDISSPFIKSLSTRYYNLTSKEIHTADLIKQGKTNKEIADFLRLSVRTIEDRRKNIREKLDLKNTKINLATYLTSLG